MFFITYKIILGILMGPGLYVIIMLFSALIIQFSKKNDKKQNGKINFVSMILVVSSLMLYTASIEPVRDFAAGISENKYMPIDDEKIKGAKAIAVLGAGINDYALDSFSKTTDDCGTPSYIALARLSEGIKIYRRMNEKYGIEPEIIVSGGKVFDGDRGEADIYRDFLIDMGVKKENIIVEDESKTTYENAVNTNKICEDKKIDKLILVTSALHMDRSVKAFKKTGGIEIIPAPSDFTSKRSGYDVFSFVPGVDSLTKFRGAVWEIIGRVYYAVKKG